MLQELGVHQDSGKLHSILEQTKDQKEQTFSENLALLEKANEEVFACINDLVKVLEEQTGNSASDKALLEMSKIKAKIDVLHEIASSKFKNYQIPFELVL